MNSSSNVGLDLWGNSHEVLPPTISICADRLLLSANEEEASAIFHEFIVHSQQFLREPFQILQNPNLTIMIQGKIYPGSVAQVYLATKSLYDKELTSDELQALVDTVRALKRASPPPPGVFFRPSLDSVESTSTTENDSIVMSSDELVSPKLKRKTFKKMNTCPNINTFPENELNGEEIPAPPQTCRPGSSASALPVQFTTQFQKSVRPSEEQLQEIWPLLNEGENTIEFIVNSSLQGERTVQASLYKLSSTQKLVVTDIDGTISKSDALGILFHIHLI